MRRVLVHLLSVTVCSAALAQGADPLCVLAPEALPPSWRPTAEQAEQLDATPWSPFEAADARAAIEAGVGEMIAYFESTRRRSATCGRTRSRL